MALEWLVEIEQSVRHAERVLRELVSSLPPDDWVPERYGEYQGWPGLIDGVDETNSGDVHWHGVIVGRWQSAGLVREALGAAGNALRLCQAVRELYAGLATALEYATTPPGIDEGSPAARELRAVLERWERGGD